MESQRPIATVICGFTFILAMALLTGCGELRLRHPVPQALADRAQVPGMPTSIRTWGDAMSPEFVTGMAESRNQFLAYYQAHPQETRPATVDFLAVSGGGPRNALRRKTESRLYHH